MPDASRPSHYLRCLTALAPPSSSRTWQSAPHPAQPIVATACADRSVRVYSLTSFTLLHSITGGHKRSVRSVSWKPGTAGQSVLATGSFDASAGIWRREQPQQEERDKAGEEEGEEGEEGDTADDYQFSCILDGHESEIKCLSWSPSGQFLATCSRDKSVWIWEELDDDNFETVAVLQEHDGDVKCVAWHPEDALLASASYDDTVRLYREDADDWVQVARLDAHGQTVWWAEFEGSAMAQRDFRAQPHGLRRSQQHHVEQLDRAGPRLATCSDDCTVRIWRRAPRGTDATHSASTGVPSIIRSVTLDEDWYQEAVLPQRHERSIYSLSWSRVTGMLVSAGSDGKIVVYKEVWTPSTPDADANDDANDDDNDDAPATEEPPTSAPPTTHWIVVCERFAAHSVYEINHVTWAKRADTGKRWENEEVVLSTGDDGEVRVWVLDECDSSPPV